MNAKTCPPPSEEGPTRSCSTAAESALAAEHGAWIGQANGTALYCNNAWQTAQAKALEPVGAASVHYPTAGHWIAALHPDDRAAAEQAWQQTTLHQRPLWLLARLCTPDGWQWHRLSSTAMPAQLAAHSWHISAMPVSNNATNTTLEQTYKSMLDASIDCIKMLSPEGRLLHVNAAGCLALGLQAGDGFGQVWLDFMPKNIRSRGLRAISRAVKLGRKTRFSGMSEVGNAVRHWDNMLSPLRNAQGQVTALLCLSRDMTAQTQTEQRLRAASETDTLTGLPNRRALYAELTHMLRKDHGSKTMLGLMLVDLDHFKHINGTLGHLAGDHVLRMLAKRLQACLPHNAYVARLGGDEFAIIHAGLAHMSELLDLANIVHRQMDEPIDYRGKAITGGLSIGCALYPRDAHSLSDLLKAADTALNDIKAGGRGGVQLYSIKMMQSAIRAADQLERARAIVREKAIEPHYQPKVTLADDRVIGFEALLRWRDNSGLHYPRGVEEAFKNYEAATKISAQMRQKVFADMARWYSLGLPLLPVSLNAAPVEFLRDDFAERLLEQIARFGLPTSLIEIEVTEHSLAERNAEYVGRSLNVLKKAGVRIALDDFGTGHSSFTNLRDYPVDCIKIDRDFIRRMQDEAVIAAIVKAVCQLGPALHLQIIAEGVETRQQCNALLEVGCEVGQGFLFSPAMPQEAVEAMLTEWKQRFQLKRQEQQWPSSNAPAESQPLRVIG